MKKLNLISETKNKKGKVTHKIESAGTLYKPTKEDTERLWRDSELKRTIEFVIIPDHPKREVYLAYRVDLFAYDSQDEFPEGTRPTL